MGMGAQRSSIYEEVQQASEGGVAEDSTTPVLVRYVIDGDYILQDFGDDGVSYLSKDQFDKLAVGEQEAAQGVNLNAWCVVKLE